MQRRLPQRYANMKRSILIVIALLFSGCDMDPFGLSTRTIAGPYELNQWEDFETYYLLGPEDTGWGTIDGTVSKVGWNKKHILVQQNDDGNGGGWRIIDIETQTVSNTMTKEKLQEHPEVKGINTYSASVAWSML